MELRLKQIVHLEIIFSFQSLNKWGEGKSKSVELEESSWSFGWTQHKTGWISKERNNFLIFRGNRKPDPRPCGVLLRCCLFVTRWPDILGTLGSVGKFLLMCVFAVGNKAIMALGWKYVRFEASEGKPKEGIGSHVECVWLDRLLEWAWFHPFAFKMCWVCTQTFTEARSFARSLCSSWALSLCIVSLQCLAIFRQKVLYHSSISLLNEEGFEASCRGVLMVLSPPCLVGSPCWVTLLPSDMHTRWQHDSNFLSLIWDQDFEPSECQSLISGSLLKGRHMEEKMMLTLCFRAS